jgi:hypothetical protein
MQLSYPLASRPTFRLLLAITLGLALAHGATLVLTFGLGYDQLFGMRRMFNLNEEQNLPTFFSALLLLGCAALLAILAAAARREDRSRRDAWYWGGLAALFLFLSVDEAASIHELFIRPVNAAAGTSDLLHLDWVVPYVGAGAIVALLYARFLMRLPRVIGFRIVAAGTIFVAGAAGIELIGSAVLRDNDYDHGTLPMKLLFLVEETLEMLGVAYFLAALLRYVELGGSPLRVAFAGGADTASERADLTARKGPSHRATDPLVKARAPDYSRTAFSPTRKNAAP